MDEQLNETKNGLQVEVFWQHGDPPFVFEAHGPVTVGLLTEIEEMLSPGGDYRHLLDQGDGDYSFRVTRVEGQYGFEGRCELEPHIHLDLEGFEPLASAKEASV